MNNSSHNKQYHGKQKLFNKFSFMKQKSLTSNLSVELNNGLPSSKYRQPSMHSVILPPSESLNGNSDDEDNEEDTDSSDSDIEYEQDPVLREQRLKSEESIDDYKQGGYHPTFIGERYGLRNQYKINRKLGWGHFSTVWLAVDEEKNRHVAIKIVRSSLNYKEAAIDEINILETVNNGDNDHPGKRHIVELLDHFIHTGPNGDHVCMVFEVLGENMLNLLVRYKEFQETRKNEIEASLNRDIGSNKLSEDIKATNLTDLQILSNSYGGLPIDLVKQICKQMLLALDYLHRECGIIHTDLKPENVLVEINDVERLVKLLELEKKNKKMVKIMERRKANRSVSDNKLRPTKNSLLTPRSPSLSGGGNRSRKNSLPVRSSKPLTSPLETSSVDNFFRSFSFSHRSTASSNSSVSSLQHFNNSKLSHNYNSPISYAKTQSLDDFYNSEVIEEEEDSDISGGLKKDIEDLHDSHENDYKIENHEKEEEAGEEDTDVGSITEAEGDVFVDARESTTPISRSVSNSASIPRSPPQMQPQHPRSSFSIPVNGSYFPAFSSNGESNCNSSAGSGRAPRRMSTMSSVSQKSVFSEFESIINIKIADLGNSCWYNKHYTSDIQTRQYRAPEVILGGEWGCSTDLWSLSCLIFELTTGDYLFDPRSTKSYTRDEDHLAQMVELLNEWPDVEYLKTTSRCHNFFDSSCKRFRRISKLKMWSLEKVLREEYGMKETESCRLGRFLRCGLQYVPAQRIDAGSLYNHEWLHDEDESSHLLDRAFGLKGEDIKGWCCCYR